MHAKSRHCDICYPIDTGMSVKEITMYRDPTIWTTDTLIPVRHIDIEARLITLNFTRPQCVKRNIMRFVHKFVNPVDQDTVILWGLVTWDRGCIYHGDITLSFYFNLFTGQLVWNNRRVNSIVGSLYDDNKPFTEQILIFEGACFNIYLLLKNIDID